MRKYSAFFVFFLSALTVQAQFSDGQAARAVLGQQTFTAGVSSPSQVILGGVSGLAYKNGILYVADSNRVAATPLNNRIMAFPVSEIPGLRANVAALGLTNTSCYLCGFPATFSLGQSTFTPADATAGFPVGRTQSGLNHATGVATDGHYFAVADTDNNRVLLWNSVPTVMDQPADLVLGQVDFTSFQTPQPVNATSLRGPQGVWFQNNKLFVADTQNHRILIWNSVPTHNNQAADFVLGQPDLVHANQPSATATSPVAAANQLLNPTSVTSDGIRLFVSDLGFNRVLIWNSIPTAMDQNADVVIGQPDMASTAANNATVCSGLATGTLGQCQKSLNYPRFALSDGTRLFIADGGNDRVVTFDHIPTTNAEAFQGVLGQQDFVQDVVSSAAISIVSTAVDNTGGVDLTPTPQALAFDGTNLYVSDPYNRRVLVFTPGDTVLPHNSIVNWASEIVRQEGIVVFTGTPVAADTATVTIASTAYTYTVKTSDTVDSIAQGIVALINATDTNATAIFAGTGSGGVYLSSKGTDLGYDTITLAATTSNTANEAATASGSYLSAGTAATGSPGMLVEINGTNLSDQTLTAGLNGQSTLPATFGGVQVFMDGSASPLFKVSPTQIVTQIPYSYGDRNSTSVFVRTVHGDGSVTVTNATPVYIAPANPGIFNAPAYSGQPRPWPISQAYHQPGNATAVISIDGTVTAANVATVTIQGVAYNYTVVTADTLATITQNLVNLINATDANVTAVRGGSFDRIVLTAKKAGAAGNGLTIVGSASTSATVTVTAYSSTTCCLVTPGSLISAANPAAPGELITVTAAGLGLIADINGVAIATPTTGAPYSGTIPNNAVNSVSATLGSTTAQVIFADLPAGSYGTYNVQVIVPQAAATNAATPLNIAQNAFISNTVTLPVGPPVLYTGTPVATAPISYIRQVIDVPAAGATVSGTVPTTGWALSTVASVTSVSVSIDGQFYGTAPRTINRPDVCAIHSSSDCPITGWSLLVDTTRFADGAHVMTITTAASNGAYATIAQSFIINNGTLSGTNPQHGSIDAPGSGSIYRGSATFSGWSLNSASSVASVAIYVDGSFEGTAVYGSARPDVCAVFAGPVGCPVGWSFVFDTTSVANGTHTLVAITTSANGQIYTLSKSFQVSNFTTFNSTQVSIDTPSASAGAFSGNIQIGGWAFDANSTVSSVMVGVDGVNYGAAAYGGVRTDVCTVYPNQPGCPAVGFNAALDTTLLADGPHSLTITVNPSAGRSSTFTRTFSVLNQNTAANPILANIDLPSTSSTVSGVINTGGWAVGSADAVIRIQTMVDGIALADAVYGFTRSDVCALYPGRAGCPNVGWNGQLDTTRLSNGTHVFEITVTTAGGQRVSVGKTFTVANPTTGPGRIAIDVPGPAANAIIGRVTFSGWALNDNVAVSGVSVTIDGIPYGQATYGSPRPDVCTVYPGRSQCASSGWTYSFDSKQFADGSHTLGITENNVDGSYFAISEKFTIGNLSGVNPVRISIDSPQKDGSAVFGTINIAGWALNDFSTIVAINIAIDGVPVGSAIYGGSRPDACSVFSGRPGCPNVGYGFGYDTALLPNGTHTVSVTAVPAAGETFTASEEFVVAN